MYSHIYLDFLSPHKTPLIKLLEYPVLLEASEIFLKYKILFFLILKSIGVLVFIGQYCGILLISSDHKKP